MKTAEYRTLRKCDGTLDEDNPLFTDADRQNFNTLTDGGFIERRESPTPLKPVQVYRFHDNRFVSTVHWLITGKCNARCKHCYMSAPEGVCGEFSHEVCMNLIEQMANCGVQKVILSGGEPLIRKDFWELVDSLLSHGICVDTIMSNGLLVNDALLDKFDERNIKPHFSMSFDGVDGWHDWLRGVTGRILPCIPFSSATFTHKHFPTVNEVTLKEVLNGSE